MQSFGAVAAVAAMCATGAFASQVQGASGIYGPAPTFGQSLTPIALPTATPGEPQGTNLPSFPPRDVSVQISPGLPLPDGAAPVAPPLGHGPEIPEHRHGGAPESNSDVFYYLKGAERKEAQPRALEQNPPVYTAATTSAAAAATQAVSSMTPAEIPLPASSQAPVSACSQEPVTVTVSLDTCSESTQSAAAEATTSTLISTIEVTSTTSVASTETLSSTVTSVLSLAPATFSTSVGTSSFSGYFNSTSVPCTTSSAAALAGTAPASASASFTSTSSNGTAPIQTAAAGSLRAPGLFKVVAKMLF